MSPREAPSALFFFSSSSDGHCGRWRWLGGGVGLQLYAPRALPSLITEDNTESRKKGAKRRDKRYPRRRIRFNFASFLLPAMFHFLPRLCNCSPHTSGSWHGMPRPGPAGRGRCAGDVPFCFLICMGVSAEWQISGETHASSPQKVAPSRVRRDAGDFSCQWRRREKFVQRVVQPHRQVAYRSMPCGGHSERSSVIQSLPFGKVHFFTVFQHRVLEACPL